MRLLHVCGVGGFAIAMVAPACSEESVDHAAAVADGGTSSSSSSGSDASGLDAGPDVFDAGPVIHTIKIHVTSPSGTFSRGGPVAPTWAVTLDDDVDAGNTWRALTASATGEYSITTEKASFSVAFACANDARSLVSVFTRTTDIADLDVVLAPHCASTDTEATDLTGTFSGLGADTGWLDFGYAFGNRGAVFPTNGGSGDYELVNLVAGSWDLAFGVRDDFGKPFTKMLIAREQNLPKGSATFDANLGTNTGAFVPGSKKLSLAGMDNEQTHVSVLYSLSGASDGLEMGPANDPDNSATGNVDYPTIPAALQKPTDRYRISAITVEDPKLARGGSAVFHDAADFTIELPAKIEAPTASVVDKRIVTKMKTREGGDVYAATVFTTVTNQSSVEWRVSTSASLVTGDVIELAPPDFSAVAGFKTAWLTPLDLARTITAAVYEKQISVGDGKLDRFARASITMDSP